MAPKTTKNSKIGFDLRFGQKWPKNWTENGTKNNKIGSEALTFFPKFVLQMAPKITKIFLIDSGNLAAIVPNIGMKMA